MSKMKVLWPDWRSAIYSELMPSVFPAEKLELITVELGDPVDLEALVADADVLVVKSRQITPRVLSAGKHLGLVLKYGTVLDNIDLGAAAEVGVAVGVFPLVHLVAVAEHAILLMLALGKRLVHAHEAVCSAQYPSHLQPFTTSENNICFNWMQYPDLESLYGKTVGMVGLGEIGLSAAKMARAFGMRVMYHKRQRIDETEERRLGLTYSSLDDLLREADFVSLHTPHTPETERMIGRRELELMKSSAFLVNTARGGVIDQDALVEVLRVRRIAGAGLDVYREEPAPRHNPLLRLDNVILTPHIAGGRPDGPVRALRDVFQRLSRVRDGENLADVVELVVEPRTENGRVTWPFEGET